MTTAYFILKNHQYLVFAIFICGLMFSIECSLTLEFDEDKENCGFDLDPFDIFDKKWNQYQIELEYAKAVIDYPDVKHPFRLLYDVAYDIVGKAESRKRLLSCIERRDASFAERDMQQAMLFREGWLKETRTVNFMIVIALGYEINPDKTDCGMPFDPFDLFHKNWNQTQIMMEYKSAINDYPQVDHVFRIWYDTAYYFVGDEQYRRTILTCMETRYSKFGLVYSDPSLGKRSKEYEIFMLRLVNKYLENRILSKPSSEIGVFGYGLLLLYAALVTFGFIIKCREFFELNRREDQNRVTAVASNVENLADNSNRRQNVTDVAERNRRLLEELEHTFRQLLAEQARRRAKRIDEFRRNVVYEHDGSLNSFATMMEPLNDADIAELPKCVICQFAYTAGETGCMRVNACGHFFHYEDCLKPWLGNPTCPMCRVTPNSDRLVLQTN